MNAGIMRYFRAYFAHWWMPVALYAAVALVLAVLIVTGLFSVPGFLAALCNVLTALLVATAFGMPVAAVVHYRRGRKVEGLANLVLFVCLFLFPALFFFAVSLLAKG